MIRKDRVVKHLLEFCVAPLKRIVRDVVLALPRAWPRPFALDRDRHDLRDRRATTSKDDLFARFDACQQLRKMRLGLMHIHDVSHDSPYPSPLSPQLHADRAEPCAHYAARVSLTPEQLADRVLAWYETHGRDLPWRHTRDPYAILVSEVMLQQTQVDRVIERWTAWLERWPTATDLAAASRADVISAWQGLGYNRRAVSLHEAARQLAEHGIPQDQAGWRALPGVGPYTAAAVCALALDHDVIPLDVNILRILERSLGATELEPPPSRAHDLTQGLFDLGATVCLARIPRCDVCPLANLCPSRGQRYEPLRKQSTFEGSRRQARSRLLDQLREAPLATGSFDPALAALLIKDGLAEQIDGHLRLPR